jgi:hypothetical protein
LYDEGDCDTFFSDVLHGHANGVGSPLRIERLEKYISGSLTLSECVHEVTSATLAQIRFAIFLVIRQGDSMHTIHSTLTGSALSIRAGR